MPRKPFTGAITDEFGPRIHPITGKYTFHYGMDGLGDGNFAPADGTLIGYGDAGGYGYRAIFVDKFGWTHWFGHNANAASLVPIGTWLPEGARVAWMGTTGSSTDDHCHWETRRPTGEVVDPRIWLAETGSASAGTGKPVPIVTPRRGFTPMPALYINVQGETPKPTGGAHLVNEDGTSLFYFTWTPEYAALKAVLEPLGCVTSAYPGNIDVLRRELAALRAKGVPKVTLMREASTDEDRAALSAANLL